MIDEVNGAINRFFGETRWLSNFAQSTVHWFGLEFKAIENAYQAAKLSADNYEEHIAEFMTCSPRAAQQKGQTIPLRETWHTEKYAVMYALLLEKFSQSPFKEQLLATGSVYLIEGNHWRDLCWGKDKETWEGMNMLGSLLMLVRAQLVGEFI